MWKYIFLLLMLISSEIILSCNAADQYRLFPLGTCASGLIVVEAHLYRTTDPKGNRYEMPSKWFGKSFLNTYDETHKLISSRSLDSLGLTETISADQFIKDSFNKGLKLAKQLPDYIAVSPVSLSHCDFQQTCREVALRNDTMKHKVFVKLNHQKEYEVTILRDTTSIAKRYLEYYSGFNSGVIDYASLDIGSIRKFKIGAKTLTVVHLASGDKLEYTDEEGVPKRAEYKPDVVFDQLESSTFYEPVLHHGHGFDFFIVE